MLSNNKRRALGIQLLQHWTVELTAVMASVIPPATRPESAVSTWTAHYTTRGRLIERRFNATGDVYQCKVYGDRRYVESALEFIPEANLFLTDDSHFQKLVSECPNEEGLIRSHARSKRAITLIFPGTKWCGPGRIASSFEDLGVYNQTDICCRSHDRCPIYIGPGHTKYNITNTAITSVTTCDCERRFRDCLKGVGTLVADLVGGIYFNTVGLPCLEVSHPETCTGFWFWKRCTRDRTEAKRLRLVQSNVTF